MTLENIMKQHNFVVVGNTILDDKYAYKIKHGLLDKGYNVSCVYKELESKIDSDGNLSIEDLSRVERNGDIIFSLLNNFRLWIDMTEDNLYGTMYRKTKKEKNNVIGGDRR